MRPLCLLSISFSSNSLNINHAQNYACKFNENKVQYSACVLLCFLLMLFFPKKSKVVAYVPIWAQLCAL